MDLDKSCIYASDWPLSCNGPVTFAPDPYNMDVDNDDTPVWMCEHHRDMRADDI